MLGSGGQAVTRDVGLQQLRQTRLHGPDSRPTKSARRFSNGQKTVRCMIEVVEFKWLQWRDTPPDASHIAVEVTCEGWGYIRLWRASASLPDDALDLLWRPCSSEILRMAAEGGLYDVEGEALYGSPRLVVNTADPNGPWPHMCVLQPPQWPDCGPPARLWLAPSCGDLVDTPPFVLGDLVAVADRGEVVVMRGLDLKQLRGFAAQVVAMSGGGWA